MSPKMWFIPFIFILLTLSGCGDDSDPRVLTNLQIAASENPVPEGFQSKLTATAFYDDGNSNTTDATWESLDETKATVDFAGLVTAVAEGEVTIRATTAEGSGTFLLTVTPATIKSIELSPVTEEVSLGFNVNYEAIGYFSDRTSHNINDHPDLVWKSSNESVAVIVKGIPGEKIARSDTLSKGTTTFTAVLGVSSNEASLTVNDHVLQSITISPDRTTLPLGAVQKFKAEGLFSDGLTPDISEDVIWSSTSVEHTVLELLDDKGTFQGVGLGSAKISATYNGDESNSEVISSDNQPLVIVEQMKMTALSVDSPIDDDTQPLGKKVQFIATGTFNNGHSYDISGYEQVYWQSNDTKTATVTSSGLVEGLELGMVTITAKSADDSWLASEEIEITNAVVESIGVEAVDGNQIITEGKTQKYNAWAVYTNKTIGENVEASDEFSWSVIIENEPVVTSNGVPPEATITVQGLLTYDRTAHDAGVAKVYGSYKGLEGEELMLLPKVNLKTVPRLSPTHEFIGALSLFEAETLDVTFSGGVGIDGEDIYYDNSALMTQSEAVGYCEELLYNGNDNWYLPESAELQALWQANIDNLVNWDLRKHYWSTTINGSGHDAVSLTDSTIIEANDEEFYYASCARSVQ